MTGLPSIAGSKRAGQPASQRPSGLYDREAREHALGLFELFGSAEKTLHANPGRHAAVPPTERAAAERFFRKHMVIAE